MNNICNYFENLLFKTSLSRNFETCTLLANYLQKLPTHWRLYEVPKNVCLPFFTAHSLCSVHEIIRSIL